MSSFELGGHLVAVRARPVLVDDRRERIDSLALQQDVDLDQRGLLLARLLVVQARVAARRDFSESKKSKMISPTASV